MEKTGSLFTKKIHSNRRVEILLIAVAIVGVIICAFICEYATNDARNIKSSERVIIASDEMDMQLDGLSYNDKGLLIADKEDAVIVIDNPNGNVLHLQYADKTRNIPQMKVGESTIYSSSVSTLLVDTDFFSYDIHGKNDRLEITVRDKGTQIKVLEIDNRYHFNYYKFFYILILGLLILFFILMIHLRYQRPEVIFLVCSLTLSMAMATMLPLSTTNTFDEQIHYSRCASVFDNSVTKYDVDLGNGSVPGLFDITLREDMNEELQQEVLNPEDKFGDIPSEQSGLILVYNRLAYVPSILIIWLMKLFGFGLPIVFIAGKAINGILYSIIMFFAIRKLKSQKVLLSVFGLVPINIFQASSYTYDWWVTGFLVLGSAYLISELQQPEKTIDLRTYVVIILSFVLGCGPKAIYCPILLSMLMLKKTKFSTTRLFHANNICSCVVCLIVASTFLLGFLVQGPGTGDIRGGSDVNATEQVAFILSEPLQYTVILTKFLIGYFSPMATTWYLCHCAYLGLGVGGVLLLVILVLAAFTDRNQCDEQTLNARNRIISWSVCFIIVCLYTSALYVDYTPVGSNIIQGVQGRYIMPLFFVVFAFIGSKRITNRIRPDIYISGMIGTTAITTMIVLGQLVIRHYY